MDDQDTQFTRDTDEKVSDSLDIVEYATLESEATKISEFEVKFVEDFFIQQNQMMEELVFVIQKKMELRNRSLQSHLSEIYQQDANYLNNQKRIEEIKSQINFLHTSILTNK